EFDYIKMVQNFTPAKVFKINLEDYHSGWALIPYGSDTYGVYKSEGDVTYHSETGRLSIKQTSSEERDPFTAEDGSRILPAYVIKFNKAEYTADRDMWKNYWHWKR